jgi:hypothetical protein
MMIGANPSSGLKILFLGAATLLPMFVPCPGVPQDVRTLCLPLQIHNGTPQEEPCLKFGSLDSVACGQARRRRADVETEQRENQGHKR